ncbi:hypothetical protein [Budvicia aquatica]|uniref:Uncharacterized protein n=1 Tax=Budvicia aquatica TaxID=82979 RepID=A0A2C6C1F8_9GAMM|nr:hypothetical protein [Budvicia aquatica]PHI30180.1 hypothetical protein CRN84_12935 [Budvicia aquatica]VFS49215.1 Uncharacterised protein [Budvicia aquatica]
MITYKNISSAFNDLALKQEERLSILRESASNLVNEYINSLGLEGVMWSDIKGKQNPYIETGWLEGGDFKRENVYRMRPDADLYLEFHVRTVVNDKPIGGDGVVVIVRIGIENDVLIIETGKKEFRFIVPLTGDLTRFHDVVESMKSLVMRTLRSVRHSVSFQ